jgi:hypothetical protein
MFHMFKKASLLGLAFGAMLVLGGASPAQADNWGRGCNARINRERHQLNFAVRRYGPYSWQARQERRELNRAIASCRYR